MSSSSSGELSAGRFLEVMAQSDELAHHDPERCGTCAHLSITGIAARAMISEGWAEKGARETIDELYRRATGEWKSGKFYRLYAQARAEGRDPEELFKERGWEL